MDDLTPSRDNLVYVTCPICGPCSKKFFCLCDGLNIMRCATCGLLFVDPRLPQDYHRYHFEREYIPSVEKVEHHFGHLREKSLCYQASLIQKHKTSGCILDIGCAGGAFLKNFPVSNWERYGIDLSQLGAEYARKKFGINVFNGDLIESHYPDNNFDVVTILDTLYFIPDPVTHLTEIYRILAKDGILCIEIPGLQFRLLKNTGLLSRIIYRKWSHLNPKEHLYFYSDSTLRKLLNKVGLEIEYTYLTHPSLYGNTLRHIAYQTYYQCTKLIYFLSKSKVNLATKVFYLARKTSKIDS